MRTVRFQPDYEGWRTAARQLLGEGVTPGEIIWVEGNSAQSALDFDLPQVSPEGSEKVKAPRRFVELAKTSVLHSSGQRWALLYRALWRLTHGEGRILENPIDADVIALNHFDKEVQKDAYRMRAFIRFRETTLEGEPWFVAWYEPEHDSVALNEDFFAGRFASMRWSILTPKRCMHWDGERISFSQGVSREAAPQGDKTEALWIAYYSNIFNPARVKPAAMQAQLLKRNWKNLPEAAAIEPLLRNARRRADDMVAKSEFLRPRESDFEPVRPPEGADLDQLREAAKSCRGCPLWKTATCTVFGEGQGGARIVLVGEQPGDHEDRTGRPFVGPAGQILDRALTAIGIERSSLYITNAVKHFKFEPSGKRRIHKTASSREVAACRPWLEAELKFIKPELIVALGATAARSLFGGLLKIGENRGQILESSYGEVLVTIHPSALLRLPEGLDANAEFEKFVSDLSHITSRYRARFSG